MLESYSVSQKEIDALKLCYYNALYGMHHFKGLKYRQCFNIIKAVKKLIPDLEKFNIDELLVVEDLTL